MTDPSYSITKKSSEIRQPAWYPHEFLLCNHSVRSVHNLPAAPKHPLESRSFDGRRMDQAARDESTTLLGTHGGGTLKKR